MLVRPINQLEPLFFAYSYYYIGSNHLLSFPFLFLKNKWFNELKIDFLKNTNFSKSPQFVTVPETNSGIIKNKCVKIINKTNKIRILINNITNQLYGKKTILKQRAD